MNPTDQPYAVAFESKVTQAAQWIARSQHLVVFTGAGISTESGIPDFRGPNGVWTRKDKGLPPPKMEKPWDEVQPNAGHYALVELQNWGILKFLISQNVDNLHLMSGIKPELIAEFHGNHALVRCLSCDRQFPKHRLWDEAKWGNGYRTSPAKPGQPVCPACGGRIVSSVVNFGDAIPAKELRLSQTHAERADLFLVVGSSLQVTPAASMPMVAKENGARLIIVNKMETCLDNCSDLRFYEGSGVVLTQMVATVRSLKQ